MGWVACGACRGLPSPGQGGPSRRGPCLVQQPDPSHSRCLQVMESVVKNCGQTVHDEVANKQTMEELKELLKVGTPGAEGPCAMPIPTWSCGHVQQGQGRRPGTGLGAAP